MNSNLCILTFECVDFSVFSVKQLVLYLDKESCALVISFELLPYSHAFNPCGRYIYIYIYIFHNDVLIHTYKKFMTFLCTFLYM